jgi:hypothetical protein
MWLKKCRCGNVRLTSLSISARISLSLKYAFHLLSWSKLKGCGEKDEKERTEKGKIKSKNDKLKGSKIKYHSNAMQGTYMIRVIFIFLVGINHKLFDPVLI